MSDWRERALCTDEPELFFPIGNGPTARRQTRDAKTICRTCPALNDCRDWALTTRPRLRDGVIGGTDPDQRARIWQAQDRQAARARTAQQAATAGYVAAAAERSATTETRVATLTAEGLSAAQVGERLGIGPRQVQRYRTRRKDRT